jgi:hypothetical protein
MRLETNFLEKKQNNVFTTRERRLADNTRFVTQNGGCTEFTNLCIFVELPVAAESCSPVALDWTRHGAPCTDPLISARSPNSFALPLVTDDPAAIDIHLFSVSE